MNSVQYPQGSGLIPPLPWQPLLAMFYAYMPMYSYAYVFPLGLSFCRVGMCRADSSLSASSSYFRNMWGAFYRYRYCREVGEFSLHGCCRPEPPCRVKICGCLCYSLHCRRCDEVVLRVVSVGGSWDRAEIAQRSRRDWRTSVDQHMAVQNCDQDDNTTLLPNMMKTKSCSQNLTPWGV